MDESDQQKREDILELLSSVCDSEGSLVLRILAASRPVPKIASVLNKYITITLEEEITADIVRFTSKRMDRISEILGVNSTEVQEIHGMIVERSRGVFLWVKLVLDELENMVHDGSTISHMKSVLETLPQDLDAFYAHMLESRLPKIGTTMHTETLRMLQWVAYSSRPLSLLELTEAVAVARSDSRDISLHWLKEGRALTLDQANRMLLTRCGGFLEVKNGIVQFIHQTVRDFLFNLPATSSLHILEHESIESVATTCLRYLKFINGRIAQKREGWQRAGGESEDPNVHSEIIDFLKSSQLALLNYAVYASQPMNRSDNPVFGNLESARQEFIPLIRKLFQRAIHFDRIDDIDLLLQNRVEIDREDTDAIRSFFESKSIDHYCFPACEGYFNVVDWLVSDCGWSVGRGLQQAFSKGHEAGIQCLLKYGVPDKDMLEELSKAAMKDQWGLVELLLKHGFKEGDMYKASYNALRNKFAGNGSRMMRILHHAASKGYGAIVGLLLKNGEDDNSKDDDGQIALHFAADGGHKEIVQQLLDHSADKKAKTNNGSTALHLASAGGHDSIIQLLIQ
ncbi:ankyrin repeat-containing domain protein, partial [Trichophaea hybrida]